MAPSPASKGTPVTFDTVAQTTFPEVDVREIALSSRLAFTLTPKEIKARRLPDLTTAYEIPALGSLVDVWVDSSDRFGIAVDVVHLPGAGTELGADSYTVRRFDLADGSVTDEAAFGVRQAASSQGAPSLARVAGTASDTVVLDTWTSSAPASDDFAVAVAPHQVIAVDLKAGKPAWTARKARPLAIDTDQVVVSTGSSQRAGKIRSLDLRTGRPRWAALPGTRSSALVGTNARLLAVAASRSGDKSSVSTLSLADGSVQATRSTRSWNWSCQTTSTTVHVCSVLGTGKVEGWDVRRGAPVWSLPTRHRLAPIVSTVSRDAVYGIIGSEHGVVLDALTGKDLGPDAGAAPMAVDQWGGLSILEGQAVFQPTKDFE